MKRTGVARTPLWRGEKLQAKIEAQLSQLLDEARTALGVSLTNAAGRAAYLADFMPRSIPFHAERPRAENP